LPDCECYKRFVFCGFRHYYDKTDYEKDNAFCASELSGLADDIANKLCEVGINRHTMQRLNDAYLVDKILLQEKNFTDAERSTVMGYVKNTPINIALNQPWKASSSELYNPARYAFDGSMDTRWLSKDEDEQYLEVDLGELHDVEKVVIVWEEAAAKSYDIQVSLDGNHWTTVWSKTDGDAEMGTVESPLNNVTCQYVRMQGHTRVKW
jgi:hypothetical protein